jgi:hypothetical protein
MINMLNIAVPRKAEHLIVTQLSVVQCNSGPEVGVSPKQPGRFERVFLARIKDVTQ